MEAEVAGDVGAEVEGYLLDLLETALVEQLPGIARVFIAPALEGSAVLYGYNGPLRGEPGLDEFGPGLLGLEQPQLPFGGEDVLGAFDRAADFQDLVILGTGKAA